VAGYVAPRELGWVTSAAGASRAAPEHEREYAGHRDGGGSHAPHRAPERHEAAGNGLGRPSPSRSRRTRIVLRRSRRAVAAPLASALISAPSSSATELSHSHVIRTITAASEPQVLLYDANVATYSEKPGRRISQITTASTVPGRGC